MSIKDDPPFDQHQPIVMVGTEAQLKKYGLEFDGEYLPTRCQMCKAEVILPAASCIIFTIGRVARICFDCIPAYNDLYEKKNGRPHNICFTSVDPSCPCSKATEVIMQKLKEHAEKKRQRAERN